MFLFSTLQLSHSSVLEYVVRRNLPSQADRLAAVVKELVDILGHSPLTVNLVHFARYVARLVTAGVLLCSFLYTDGVQDLSSTATRLHDVRSALALVPVDEAHKFSTSNVRISEPDRVESLWRRMKDVLLHEAESNGISVDPSSAALDMASALYK
jgi:hypothetical protein